MQASETLGLLNCQENASENHRDLSPTVSSRHWKATALVVILGCATLIANLANSSRFSNDKGVQLSNHVHFDEVYHTWESALYQQAKLVSIEGKAKRHSSEADVNVDGNEDQAFLGDLIYFNHSKAFDMLEATKPSLARDFFLYQQGWDAQINQAYCAVASSMAAMNSLRGKIDLPQDPIYVPYPWATQMTLIKDECVRTNVYDIDKMENVFWGLGLDMTASLLCCHLTSQGFVATAFHVDPNDISAKAIRSIFMDALKDEDTRLLINYDRGGISQGPMGHGHFSPIGAYNYEKDAFLVMDVAKYKHPPVWVPTAKLMGGIGSIDFCSLFSYPEHPIDISYPSNDIGKQIGCQSMYRGYILITKEMIE